MITNYNTLKALVADLWDCRHRLQEMIAKDDQESDALSALQHAEHQLSVLLEESLGFAMDQMEEMQAST